ncbi:MAG: F0F1 ATP synthase subunit alpha [Candidatus Margulisbacteria bacterium]|nr:F0F1 ATP synthase subunit alpha [Candidatus Margulisiibacteriota bacterium]MBU1617189.1 F0F1 ATP synthase subunit alpha [Candidatus Margulisiibacteriota bacterium]MBU1867437.1 F0F1 ATP synthase subunit alpha [Candidatus Margulisiibacteriota bacterium]
MTELKNYHNISEAIKKRIEEFEAQAKVDEVGIILESGDGIARIRGLSSAQVGGMIEFPNNTFGLVSNLERDEITAMILAGHVSVREGDWAKNLNRLMEVPVGDALLGRVVNALGQPLDGRGPINSDRTRPLEAPAPAVIDRHPVSQPLQTGYKIIDALIPIGRGQRELIIGDRSTGKSTIAIDTIINQKDQNVICIYVAIGQKTSTVVETVATLIKHDALKYTVVVDAPASDPAALQYLAPFAGTAIGEEFMYQGKDVLIVYDDLSKHANAYRMISLLLRRPPGREAYPGDVFYLHSRLLERSAKLSKEKGGGSLTALPIIETQLGDVSAYIPTNVISITDGQIFLSTDYYNQGIRPAIDAGISVSRVGGKAQIKAMRKVSGSLKLDLARYREKQSFEMFSSELEKETQDLLAKGALLVEALKQSKHEPLPVEEQIAFLYGLSNNYFNTWPKDSVKEYKARFFDYCRTRGKDILASIKTSLDIAPETEASLKELIISFLKTVK